MPATITEPTVTGTGVTTAAEPGLAPESETGATTPAGTEAETGPETQVETGGDAPAGEQADAVIRLEGGEPVGGPATVKVRKGDVVRIVVRADADDDLHLHGYDLERGVGPGRPAVFSFVAEFEGIFELESHHAGALVAKVVVEP